MSKNSPDTFFFCGLSFPVFVLSDFTKISLFSPNKEINGKKTPHVWAALASDTRNIVPYFKFHHCEFSRKGHYSVVIVKYKTNVL